MRMAAATLCGLPRRLRSVVRFSGAVTVVLSILFVIGARPLVQLFVTDPAVVVQASVMLQCLAFALPAIALRLCAQISLQAAVLPAIRRPFWASRRWAGCCGLRWRYLCLNLALLALPWRFLSRRGWRP